jgi:tRNA modification GTPase
MLARQRDPIVAVATAPGRGAVGIVRVSGSGIGGVVQALCGRSLAPRHAHYGPFFGEAGEVLDQGLALYFPGPHSYTGEDVLELQAHGGPVLLQLLLARCLQAGTDIGLRLAEPGEFTRRAFLNDKLDLAQAEAVADLIDAGTEAAARSASRSLAGGFSAEVHALRDELVNLRMLVEATLDFPEEEIDFLEKANARGRLDRVAARLDTVLDRSRQGALLREGIKVVLAGQPNVGKSSLLNALAGAELAIVTPIPGTTRDKVSETIQIDGVPLHVIDTAGLREADEATDEVERIGIGRSWAEIEAADAVIFLHDLTRAGEPAYEAGNQRIAERLLRHQAGQGRLLWVGNKADLAPDATLNRPPVPAQDAERAAGPVTEVLRLSATTGDGLEALRRQLLTLVGWHAQPEGLFIARSRHVHALQRARSHLAEAQAQAALADVALDLLAEELRLAQQALAEITGEFSADDLLGEIFGRFCIGK